MFEAILAPQQQEQEQQQEQQKQQQEQQKQQPQQQQAAGMGYRTRGLGVGDGGPERIASEVAGAKGNQMGAKRCNNSVGPGHRRHPGPTELLHEYRGLRGFAFFRKPWSKPTRILNIFASKIDEMSCFSGIDFCIYLFE